MTTRFSLILPAYNEARRIRSTVEKSRTWLEEQGHSFEILVTADGNDGTREIVAEMARHDSRLRVLGSVERGGKGRGIRHAVSLARGEIIGFSDADYKTPIEEVARILPWFDQGYDLVIGSRAMPDSQIERRQKLYRQLGSRAFGKIMQTLTGLWEIGDTQCGFKFFRGPVARHLFSQQRIDGYMFDVEILYLAKHAGYKLKQVGIRWQDDGDSRLQLVAGNWRNMLDLLSIRCTRYAKSAASRAQDAPSQRRAA